MVVVVVPLLLLLATAFNDAAGCCCCCCRLAGPIARVEMLLTSKADRRPMVVTLV